MNINHYKFWPARIPHELVYPRVPLFEFLDTSARRYPESDAIIYYGTRISYLSLLNAVEKLAGELHGMGVKKGDRVALYLQNSPHFIISFFGVMRANAVVVPANPMLTERELKFVIEDSGSDVLITTPDLYSRAAGLKDKTLREIIVGDYNDYLPESAAIPVPAGIAARGEISGDAIPWQKMVDKGINDPHGVIQVNQFFQSCRKKLLLATVFSTYVCHNCPPDIAYQLSYIKIIRYAVLLRVYFSDSLTIKPVMARV